MYRIPLIGFVLCVISCAFLASCENNISTVNLLTAADKTPLLVEKDANILYNDSGREKMHLVAPLIKRYGGTTPVDSFSKGMNLDFYDDHMNPKSHVSAKKGIVHYEKDKELMEADDSVVVVNQKGDTLNTDQLFWDETKHTIYTTKFVKITTKTQILYGDGLQSNEDFTNYKITNIKGSVMVNQK